MQEIKKRHPMKKEVTQKHRGRKQRLLMKKRGKSKTQEGKK
jgi:hypothetical protein